MATVHREPNQVKWIGVRPGHNGEQILLPIDTAVNADVYTVPADKMLLLFDWHLGGVRAIGFTGHLYVYDDTPVVIASIATVSSEVGEPGTSTSNALWVPIELPEDYAIKVVTAKQVEGYIHGILIDV